MLAGFELVMSLLDIPGSVCGGSDDFFSLVRVPLRQAFR